MYSNSVYFPYRAQLVGDFDYIKHGILDLKFAETFSGHRYKALILEEDITVYRAGQKGEPFGQYYSLDKPLSELQVRVDKGIRKEWGEHRYSV